MTTDRTDCGNRGSQGARDTGGGAAQRAVGWSVVEAAVPEFAVRVPAAVRGVPAHVLGTLRKDGAPRLTGLEADFRYGELWLGMMVGSRKVLDLRRDPRFSLHANPGPGTDLAER